MLKKDKLAPKGFLIIQNLKRKNKWKNYLFLYCRENGDLERLQRFWFTGACKPGERKRSSSKPLALGKLDL